MEKWERWEDGVWERTWDAGARRIGLTIGNQDIAYSFHRAQLSLAGASPVSFRLSSSLSSISFLHRRREDKSEIKVYGIAQIGWLIWEPLRMREMHNVVPLSLAFHFSFNIDRIRIMQVCLGKSNKYITM